MSDLREKNAKEIKQLEDKKKACDTLKKQEDTDTKRLQELRDEFRLVEDKYVQIQQTESAVQTSIAKATRIVEEQRQEAKKLEEKTANDVPELEKLVKEVEEGEANIEKNKALLEEETKKLMDNLASIKQSLLEKQQAHAPHERQVTECKQKLISAERELAGLKEQMQGVQSDVKRQEEIAKEMQAKYEEASRNEADNTNRLEKAIQRRLALEKSLNDLGEEKNKLRARYEDASLKVAAMKETQTQSGGRGRIVEALMREKKNGRRELQGVFGVLGDLGWIPAEYDVAISTACPGLRNILVDNAATAQACMRYLRDHQLGRATFIALDKQQNHLAAMKQPFKAPEGSQRLFDLIRPSSDSFLPAFFSEVRNTLVTRTLEEANPIAYGPVRYRVVTLSGELIDVTGTMSGGGSQKMTGAMNTEQGQVRHAARTAGAHGSGSGNGENKDEFTPERLAKAEEEIRRVEEALERITSKIGEIESSLRETNEEVRRLELVKPRLALASNSSRVRHEEAQEALKQKRHQAERSEHDEKRSTELEKEIVMLKKSLQQAIESASATKAALDEVKKQLMEKGGAALNKKKQAINDAVSKLEAKKEDIARIEVTQKSAPSRIKAALKKAEDAEKELATLKKKADDLTTEKKAAEDRAIECVEAINKGQGELSQLNEKVKALRQEVEMLDRGVRELKRAEQSLENEIGDLESSMRSVDQDIRNYTREVKRALQSARDERNRLMKVVVTDTELQRMEKLAMAEARESAAIEASNRFETLKKQHEEEKVSKAALDAAERALEEARNYAEVARSAAREMKESDMSMKDEEGNGVELREGDERGEDERKRGNNAGNSSSSNPGRRGDIFDFDVNAPLVEASIEFGVTAKDNEPFIDKAPEIKLLTLLELDAYADGGPAMLNELIKRGEAAENESRVIEKQDKERAVAVAVEFRRRTQEWITRQAYLTVAKDRCEAVKSVCDSLSMKRKVKFEEGLRTITGYLKEMYQRLTGDGAAELEQIDRGDFTEGINFTVRPPKKSWKHIANLSGGEKTLSSLSLVFALHMYKVRHVLLAYYFRISPFQILTHSYLYPCLLTFILFQLYINITLY